MKEFKKISRKTLSNSFIDDIMGVNSHPQLHYREDEYALNRILNGEVNAGSSFESKEQMEKFVIETLSYKRRDIDDWLYNQDELEFTIKLNFSTNHASIGIGFKRDAKTKVIHEYETKGICCVLRKNFDRPYGFVLTTAYPNIYSQSAMRTNNDIIPILEKTDAYQKASPIKKAYMKYQVSNTSSDLNVWYGQDRNTIRVGQSNDYICVEERIGNTSKFNRVTITEDDMILSTLEKPDKHNELKKPHKIFSDIVEVIKPMLSDGEKPKLENSLLKGGNHAAFKSLHGKMCTVVDTIFNNIRSESGKSQLDVTKITEMKQNAAYLSETKQNDKGKTIV